MDDVGAHAVEEVLRMGHHHEDAVEVLERVLEPHTSLEICMESQDGVEHGASDEDENKVLSGTQSTVFPNTGNEEEGNKNGMQIRGRESGKQCEDAAGVL